MRLTDGFLALPSLMVALVVISILGPSIPNVILVIGLTRWMAYARVIRGEVLKLMEMDFVRLAHVAGASRPRIMVRHILPNVSNTLLVLVTLEVGLAVIAESSLSFLGFGVPRPLPSWGQHVEGRPGVHLHHLVVAGVPRAGHYLPGDVLQPDGGLASGPSRPHQASTLASLL